MTIAQMAALLKESHALARMEAVIATREDLTQTFEWSCVVVAIRERQAVLIALADTMLRESTSPAENLDLTDALLHVPGRVH